MRNGSDKVLQILSVAKLLAQTLGESREELLIAGAVPRILITNQSTHLLYIYIKPQGLGVAGQIAAFAIRVTAVIVRADGFPEEFEIALRPGQSLFGNCFVANTPLSFFSLEINPSLLDQFAR